MQVNENRRLWEGGSPFLPSPAQTQKMDDVNATLKKVANIDKNNGLIYAIRVNKKPELMV